MTVRTLSGLHLFLVGGIRLHLLDVSMGLVDVQPELLLQLLLGLERRRAASHLLLEMLVVRVQLPVNLQFDVELLRRVLHGEELTFREQTSIVLLEPLEIVLKFFLVHLRLVEATFSILNFCFGEERTNTHTHTRVREK